MSSISVLLKMGLDIHAKKIQQEADKVRKMEKKLSEMKQNLEVAQSEFEAMRHEVYNITDRRSVTKTELKDLRDNGKKLQAVKLLIDNKMSLMDAKHYVESL